MTTSQAAKTFDSRNSRSDNTSDEKPRRRYFWVATGEVGADLVAATAEALPGAALQIALSSVEEALPKAPLQRPVITAT